MEWADYLLVAFQGYPNQLSADLTLLVFLFLSAPMVNQEHEVRPTTHLTAPHRHGPPVYALRQDG